MSVDPHQDPGWLPAFKRALPGAASGGPEGVGGLLLIRALFITLTLAAFMILFVLTFIIEDIGSPDPLLAGVVVAVSLAGVAGGLWTRGRPLEGSDASEVAGAYRTLFFVGFAVNEVALVCGFVLSFLQEELWPYLTALSLFTVGMLLIAPGRRNLDKRDEQLRARGSAISLRAALNEPVTGARSGGA